MSVRTWCHLEIYAVEFVPWSVVRSCSWLSYPFTAHNGANSWYWDWRSLLYMLSLLAHKFSSAYLEQGSRCRLKIIRRSDSTSWSTLQTLNTYPLLVETAYVKTSFNLQRHQCNSTWLERLRLFFTWGCNSSEYPMGRRLSLTLCPPGCAFTPHLKFIVRLLSLTFVFPYCTFWIMYASLSSATLTSNTTLMTHLCPE